VVETGMACSMHRSNAEFRVFIRSLEEEPTWKPIGARIILKFFLKK
jgi:hypothetical protein